MRNPNKRIIRDVVTQLGYLGWKHSIVKNHTPGSTSAYAIMHHPASGNSCMLRVADHGSPMYNIGIVVKNPDECNPMTLALEFHGAAMEEMKRISRENPNTEEAKNG